MRIFRNPDVMWREEDEYREQVHEGLARGDDVAEVGTSVLYHDGMMLSLNILGTEIWKRCEGRTIDEIVSELVEVFDVEPETLKKDAEGFLKEMEQQGLVYYES